MDRTTKRAALAAMAAGMLAAGVWEWVRFGRHRVDADYQLDLVSAGRPGLRVNATLRSDVGAFYDRRNLAPVWITETTVDPRAAAALDVLDRAAAHGLDPVDYEAWELRRQADALAPREAETIAAPGRLDSLMQFEVRLTSALLSLGHDVSVGRTSPAALDPRWQSERTPPDLARTLDTAIAADISQWLGRIQPRHPEYAALQAVLADPDRLRATGVEAAADIVAVNMERWRWLPDDLGARHLFVNIPSYTLLAREDNKTALTMRVAVGKPVTNQTPVVSSVMSTLVFRPTWSIPASIVATETIPAVLRDPTYLRRQNIDVLRMTSGGAAPVDPATLTASNAADLKRLMYRQRSGAGNALGLVKFLFPNDYDVYLHDTPSDAAFSRVMRAVSHGCVRLEQPDALAEYVLGGADGWTGTRVRRAMSAGKEQFVRLPSPLPVHLVYFTATVDDAGVLTLLTDVYGLDAKQLKHGLAGGYIARIFTFSL